MWGLGFQSLGDSRMLVEMNETTDDRYVGRNGDVHNGTRQSLIRTVRVIAHMVGVSSEPSSMCQRSKIPFFFSRTQPTHRIQNKELTVV